MKQMKKKTKLNETQKNMFQNTLSCTWWFLFMYLSIYTFSYLIIHLFIYFFIWLFIFFRAEQVTREVWDYVFFKDAPLPNTDIPVDKLKWV